MRDANVFQSEFKHKCYILMIRICGYPQLGKKLIFETISFLIQNQFLDDGYGVLSAWIAISIGLSKISEESFSISVCSHIEKAGYYSKIINFLIDNEIILFCDLEMAYVVCFIFEHFLWLLRRQQIFTLYSALRSKVIQYLSQYKFLRLLFLLIRHPNGCLRHLTLSLLLQMLSVTDRASCCAIQVYVLCVPHPHLTNFMTCVLCSLSSRMAGCCKS